MATLGATRSGFLFLSRFLRNPREVGALWPSTRHLADAMVQDLDLGPGDLVVEYGCGTGAFTGRISALVASRPGARYLGIEREPDFCRLLRRRFPHLDFAEGQVERTAELLAERGLPAPRAILSGLPLILLPTMEQIVTGAARLLEPDGEFRTFSYLQSAPTPGAIALRRLMRRTFASYQQSRLVWRNFPPAFVLRGRAPGVAASESG